MSIQSKCNHRRRYEVFSHYSNGEPQCSCCGEKRLEFLSIDHVNGGGCEHRKTIGGGGLRTYSWLKKNNYPKGFRVLCHNCNQSIGSFGYCPHEVERGEKVGSIKPTLTVSEILREKILNVAIDLAAKGIYPSIPKIAKEVGNQPTAIVRHRNFWIEAGKWPVIKKVCLRKPKNET